ncbi:branched-chain amino acid ABC transporter permease [Chelatococcus reniformis]|uniref:Branched-chain amino acid ABC transporter permease n=1 Tax=Chelatococcus reniformis TaxID=1494448 RepID=A0A916TWS2_9HYPH|nr:branched-chain amino acid ABC transporter permease [Chelatococcus reniformis]GGC47760.1 hypothetical protein GCM10010994_03640 [Chelatococcus reniformis]
MSFPGQRYLGPRPNTLIIAVCVLVALPVVLTRPVWTDSAVVLGVYALLGLSVGISYGQAGILTMSQGAFAAIGGYAAAILTTRFGWPPYADLLVAMALPAALAYGVARLVTRLSPLATALATLALGSVIEILIRNADALTGGYIGLAGIPSVGAINTPAGYACLAWGMIVVTVFLYENLMCSAYGRALNVLRVDQARARADGIDVPALMSAGFAVSAAVAGAAGWLYAHYISFLSPESLDTHISISALLMAVIGGAGYILGPIVGTLLFDGLTRLMPAAELQGFFYGAALIIILLAARTGILGLLAGLARRLRRPDATPAPRAANLSPQESLP